MTETDLAADRMIATRLTRTWDAFFAHYGRLTAVQRAAIPAILDGESVLLSAPTAAGKTEAACAPIIERLLRLREPWRVLYVSPTRALVNDLHERLFSPLERLGVRLARRTGEHRSGAEEAKVLLTTPESLDSMLCRGGRKDGHGHMLASTTAIVLDEIHLLHASARGEQLRWLLTRLRRLRRYAREQGWTRDEKMQIVALSATVPDFEAVRSRFVPNGSLITIGGGRTIEEVALAEGQCVSEVGIVAYLARSQEPEKLLVFCKSRKRVDLLALTLRDALLKAGYDVRAHHGSLSQQERESAEEAVRRTRKIILVATSTLEVGVDIGDIDLVVLDSPAFDVSSLLQRLGRGNRRSGKTRVLVCGKFKGEFLIHRAMLDAARAARLGVASEGPQLAVAIQQVCSFVFQSQFTYRERTTVEGLVRDCLPEHEPTELIAQLATVGVIRLQDERVYLGEETLEKTTRGELHSNIESSRGVSVINEKTGDTMATGVVHRGGRHIGVGGVSSEIRQVTERAIHVRTGTGIVPDPDNWSYQSRTIVSGPGQPTAVRDHLGLGAHQWPHLTINGSSVIFHFGDARMHTLIRLATELHPASGQLRADAWTLRFFGPVTALPRWLVQIDVGSLDAVIARDLDRVERMLGRPYSNKQLPPSWRQRELGSWLRLSEGVADLARATLIPVQEEGLRRCLVDLLQLIDA